MPSPSAPTGVLVLAGTPIGQAGDASQRLVDELARADLIAAEDTRRRARLAGELGVEVKGRVTSYFEGNEAARTPGLVDRLIAPTPSAPTRPPALSSNTCGSPCGSARAASISSWQN